MIMLTTNIDKKSLETEFFIAICRPSGDKWQSKTLFLAIFDLCLLIVKSVCDCSLPGVYFSSYCLLPQQKHCKVHLLICSRHNKQMTCLGQKIVARSRVNTIHIRRFNACLACGNNANSLDPDQDQCPVGPDLDPNRLTPSIVFLNEFFLIEKVFKMSADDIANTLNGSIIRVL